MASDRRDNHPCRDANGPVLFPLELTAAGHRPLGPGPLSAPERADQPLRGEPGRGAAHSLALALAVGVVVELLLCWALGPGWSSSLGLMAVLSGLFWSVASRQSKDKD